MLSVLQHLFTGTGARHVGVMLMMVCVNYAIFSSFGVQM